MTVLTQFRKICIKGKSIQYDIHLFTIITTSNRRLQFHEKVHEWKNPWIDMTSSIFFHICIVVYIDHSRYSNKISIYKFYIRIFFLWRDSYFDKIHTCNYFVSRCVCFKDLVTIIPSRHISWCGRGRVMTPSPHGALSH